MRGLKVRLQSRLQISPSFLLPHPTESRLFPLLGFVGFQRVTAILHLDFSASHATWDPAKFRPWPQGAQSGASWIPLKVSHSGSCIDLVKQLKCRLPTTLSQLSHLDPQTKAPRTLPEVGLGRESPSPELHPSLGARAHTHHCVGLPMTWKPPSS